MRVDGDGYIPNRWVKWYRWPRPRLGTRTSQPENLLRRQEREGPMQRGESERAIASRILDGWSRDTKNDIRDLRRRRWCRTRTEHRPTPFTNKVTRSAWR